MRRRDEEKDDDKGIKQEISTMCINCSTVCGMIAYVEQGKLVKLEGNPRDPNSRGKLCAKGHAAVNMLYDPNRILYPLKRVGKRGEGKWERISWGEAITFVSDQLRSIKKRGYPERLVLQYGRDRTNGLLERFTYAFGTPNKVGHRGLCSLNKRMAIKAAIGDTDWDTNDVVHTKYMLNFGSNFYEAHQGHVPFLQRVVDGRIRAQATLVTFDVRLSHTAAQSDEWHPIYPGTDGLVALAMANVIMQEGLYDKEFIEKWTTISVQDLKDHLASFTPEWAEEESGVSAGVIRRIATAFAQAAPHCTTISNRGSHAHYNGFYNESAVILLNAIIGSVGKKGGWCYVSGKPDPRQFPHPVPMPPKPSIQTELSHPAAFPLVNRLYPGAVSSTIYPYIASGKVKVEALISYYVNAPMSWPEGETTVQDVYLDEVKIPFHVAIDAFYSESAHLADIILPDATFLEKWDLDTRNSYELVPYVGLRQSVVPPRGESRDIRDILKDIALEIGEGMEAYFSYESAEQYVREWAKSVPGGWETFRREGVYWDEKAPKYYEPYKRKLSDKELEGTYVEKNSGVIRKADGTAAGIMIDGEACQGFQTPTRKFTIYNPMIIELNKLHGTSYSPLPTYVSLGNQELAPDQFVLTTFKWNVHTQSRTMNQKWLAEIRHHNPIWIHPQSAQQIGVEDGDTVVLQREDCSIQVAAHLTEGIHPKVVAISASMGHTQYGPTASGNRLPVSVTDPLDSDIRDLDLEQNQWWVEKGYNPNAMIQSKADPVGGGQAWNDTVVSLRKGGEGG